MKNLVLLILILGGLTAGKPVRTVTGKVTGADGSGLPGVNVVEKGTTNGTTTDWDGEYRLSLQKENSVLVFSFIGMQSKVVPVGERTVIDVQLEEDVEALQEVVVTALGMERKVNRLGYGKRTKQTADVFQSPGRLSMEYDREIVSMHMPAADHATYYGGEDYQGVEENPFFKPLEKPLSTFSIDVDAASYSNVRRFLNNGMKPPVDAVRLEEMINYFSYDYPQPKGDAPFSITTNYMKSPWNEEHLLVQIGLQGKKIDEEKLPASNLVFLLDVSGSMSAANKLPLLKSSLKMLVNKMRPEDKVSIVVYAGAAGLALEPTSGTDKRKIMDALEDLQAGGSTAGGAGIQLAYRIAKQQFVEGGNNRIILATDGDFNVGMSSNQAMEKLIEEKRKEGVFLTVLGFGMGNYKDSKMEILADKGNGNYAYIDNLKEAQKVLITEFGGTLHTIAKDVKIQVEFNPAQVQAYRLIGYENRVLKDEDFNNDRKDAGELGSGHTVTALYEVVPVGVKSRYVGSVDPLKYQQAIDQKVKTSSASEELLTVKFRYKAPNGDTSKLITSTLSVKDRQEEDANLQWSAAVAGFGMLLRDSDYSELIDYDEVLALAQNAKGEDAYGYRSEFIQLVRLASNMAE